MMWAKKDQTTDFFHLPFFISFFFFFIKGCQSRPSTFFLCTGRKRKKGENYYFCFLGWVCLTVIIIVRIENSQKKKKFSQEEKCQCECHFSIFYVRLINRLFFYLLFYFYRDKDLREGMSEDRRDRSLRTLIRNFYQFHLNEIYYVLRNEYTDWDRPSALDALSMRDSLSLALSDALVVAPLMHVVHLHAQRSANPSGTFFYHYQGQQQQQQQQQTIMTQPPTINVGQQQNNDADLSEYNVRITSPSIFFRF